MEFTASEASVSVHLSPPARARGEEKMEDVSVLPAAIETSSAVVPAPAAQPVSETAVISAAVNTAEAPAVTPEVTHAVTPAPETVSKSAAPAAVAATDLIPAFSGSGRDFDD